MGTGVSDDPQLDPGATFRTVSHFPEKGPSSPGTDPTLDPCPPLITTAKMASVYRSLWSQKQNIITQRWRFYDRNYELSHMCGQSLMGRLACVPHFLRSAHSSKPAYLPGLPFAFSRVIVLFTFNCST